MSRKRKKKKKNIQCHQQSRQRHKKEYLEKFDRYVRMFDLQDFFSVLTEDDFRVVYYIRSSHPKVEIGDDSKNTPRNLKIVTKSTKYIFDTLVSYIFKGSPDITFHEFMGICNHINNCLVLFQEHESKEVQDAYVANKEKIDRFKKLHGKAFSRVILELGLVGIHLSDFNEYYWFTLPICEKKTKRDRLNYVCMKLHYAPGEKKNVCLNGKNRTVYRLGETWYDQKLTWLAADAGKLGVDVKNGSRELKVYIQLHAANRLRERLDSGHNDLLKYHLNRSVKKCAVVNSVSGPLLEYWFHDIKLGYLRFNVLEDMLILRTFLFLTNDKTPEGIKLRELAGLEMQDKTFLNIDRLSTFLQPDVRENGFIRDLFTKAGCGVLFEHPKEFFDSGSININASKIESYITKRENHLSSLKETYIDEEIGQTVS